MLQQTLKSDSAGEAKINYVPRIFWCMDTTLTTFSLLHFGHLHQELTFARQKWRIFDNSQLFEIFHNFLTAFWQLDNFLKKIDNFLTKKSLNIENIWKSSFAPCQVFASNVVSSQFFDIFDNCLTAFWRLDNFLKNWQLFDKKITEYWEYLKIVFRTMSGICIKRCE